jgi:hypothetical protein
MTDRLPQPLTAAASPQTASRWKAGPNDDSSEEETIGGDGGGHPDPDEPTENDEDSNT